MWTPIEQAGILAGGQPGDIPAEVISSAEMTTPDGSTIEFTYIMFEGEEGKCRYVVATDPALGTVGATGSCGHASDTFAASWTVGSITVEETTFAIAFGSDYETSEIESVEVEIADVSQPLIAQVEDGNWLAVAEAPSDDVVVTELRGLSNGHEIASVDTRPPHLQDG
jgi:hypothetical protein